MPGWAHVGLILAALVAGGCNGTNGNHEAAGPRSLSRTVAIGSESDLWIEDLPLAAVRRSERRGTNGYEVWFSVGGTHHSLWWPRREIDLGDGAPDHANRWIDFSGQRVSYPAAITAESAPRIYEAITWIEANYRGQAKGGIIAAEAFGDIAVLGSLVPSGAGAASLGSAGATLPPARGVWALGWAARGRRIEAALGGNLPDSFPVIDRFAHGTVTSIKSLDLGARTYQDVRKLFSTVKGYIGKVSRFRSASWNTVEISAEQVKVRALELVVPSAGNAAQQRTLQQLIEYARSVGVQMKVIVYP